MNKKHDDVARATLKRLIDEGYSAAQVAAATDLGSRNAVLGLAFRLGLRFASTSKKNTARKDGIKAAPRHPSPQNAKAPISGPMEPSRTGAVAEAAPVKKPEIKAARRHPALATAFRLEPRERGRFQIWHLSEAMCHLPLGDPREDDFHYCGAAKPVEGGPYCADHAQLAYTAARSDTREARCERGKMRFYEFTKVRASV